MLVDPSNPNDPRAERTAKISALEHPSGEIRLPQDEGQSPANLLDEPAKKFAPVPYEEPPTRFGLSELIVWMTLICLALGTLKWLHPATFAGIYSLMALGWWVVFCVWKPEARMFFVVWWALVAVYFMACVIAIATPARLP